jgi:hypothetical protein
MTTAQELTQIVSEAAKDSPYIVKSTDKGFEVSLNIVDAKWVLPLGTGQVKKYFRIDAKLDETTHAATLNDTLYELEWTAGVDGSLVPHIGAQLNMQQGEIHEMQFGAVIGKPTGSTGGQGVVTYSFTSDKAKKWLNEILAANDWKKKMGMQAKIGLTVGAIMVVIGVVGAILALTGVIHS